jgi:hypothetical protein
VARKSPSAEFFVSVAARVCRRCHLCFWLILALQHQMGPNPVNCCTAPSRLDSYCPYPCSVGASTHFSLTHLKPANMRPPVTCTADCTTGHCYCCSHSRHLGRHSVDWWCGTQPWYSWRVIKSRSVAQHLHSPPCDDRSGCIRDVRAGHVASMHMSAL